MLGFTLKTNNECFGSADGEVKKMIEFIRILVVGLMKCPAALSTSQGKHQSKSFENYEHCDLYIFSFILVNDKVIHC